MPDERAPQQTFTSLIAHALRGPLHTLRNSMSLLHDEEHVGALNHSQRLLLGAAREATRELERVVEDVIVLTRVEAATLKLTPEPIALDALLAAATTEAQLGDAKVAPWPVSLSAIPTLSPLICDVALARRALAALIENAIRFSKANMPVTIAVAPAGEGVEITIHGGDPAGLEGEAAERIFEPLVTLRPALRPSGLGLGLGLGLPVARALILAHGGSLTLRADSAAHAAGGMVSVVCALPLAPAPRA